MSPAPGEVQGVRGWGMWMGGGMGGFCHHVKASSGERDGRKEETITPKILRALCLHQPSPLRPLSECNFHLEQPTGPSVKDWLNKWCLMHSTEYYITLKKNTV